MVLESGWSKRAYIYYSKPGNVQVQPSMLSQVGLAQTLIEYEVLDLLCKLNPSGGRIRIKSCHWKILVMSLATIIIFSLHSNFVDKMCISNTD